MSSTVKNISISYDAINELNTFSSGDFITGRIILELAKDAEINSLSVKAKGKTEVLWTEHHNKNTVTYHAKEKYFSILQHVLQKQSGGDHGARLTDQCGETYSNVIVAGSHVYPFTFQIPHGDMPSSFNGVHGKVIYTLEAKLSRSMRLPSKTKATFNFVSKPDMSNPQLMSPQYGTKSKKMKLFTSGNASINISTERMGYMQGEGLKIMVEIENSSSRALAPKYAIYQKQSFFARGKRRVSTNDILKEVGEPVPPSTNQKITKVLNIPPDLPTSILKCPILKVEYKLKVYLDVPYATDPEIKVPLVILAPDGFSQVAQPGTFAGFQQYGNSNQAGWNNYPPQPAPGPYAPQPVLGPYAPQPPPGPYAPPSAPGACAPPSAPGACAPPSAPGLYAPPSAPGPYAPQPTPGPYAAQPTPGPYAPQFSPGVYPSQNASGTQPPEAPAGIYPSLTNVKKGPS